MDRKHILIVDDDVNMLKMLRMFLQEDYKVSIVDSGKLALDFVVKFTPDLILLDYMMPLFDGPHVLEIIRKREESKNVPVLFLTSDHVPLQGVCLFHHGDPALVAAGMPALRVQRPAGIRFIDPGMGIVREHGDEVEQ